jgi:hypothetical protein
MNNKDKATENRQGGSAAPVFHVGDRVWFEWGDCKVEGVIQEDRGPLAAGGRRLYRIVFTIDPTEPVVIEMPADEIAAVR